MHYAKYGRISLAIMAMSTALMSTIAAASSENAWRDFRADVEKKCRGAVDDSLNVETIAVDPFGSKHFGLARMTGHEHGAKNRLQLLCVYDKQSQQAEIGSPMDIETDMQTERPQ